MDSFERHLNKGKESFNKGKPYEALKSFNSAELIKPGEKTVLFEKGLVYYEIGDFESAKECFRKSLDINREDSYVMLIKSINDNQQTSAVYKLKGILRYYIKFLAAGLSSDEVPEIIENLIELGDLKLKNRENGLSSLLELPAILKTNTKYKIFEKISEIYKNFNLNHISLRYAKKVLRLAPDVFKQDIAGKYLPKKKILLILAPVVAKNLKPVGIAYLISYLKVKGNYEVKFINLNDSVNVSNDEDGRFWAKRINSENFLNENKELIDYCMDEINNFNPDIIGFSVWNSAKWSSLILSEKIKEIFPEKLIIIGGYDCSLHTGEYINFPQIDIVVKGEGERTFLEIANKYIQTGRVLSCKGAVLKRNGQIKDWGRRGEIMNIDKLPYPDYTQYKNLNGRIPLSFNRGCKWGCAYCNIMVHMRKFRSRSPSSLVKEIKYQMERHPGVNYFDIGDANALQDLEVIDKFCDTLISNNITVDIDIWATINPKLNFKLLKKMKKAGFSTINYGFESGSESVVSRMRRRNTISDARRILRATHKADIAASLSLIIGLPGETEEDFQKTLKFIKDNKEYITDISQTHTFHVLYRSPIYKKPEKYGMGNYSKEELLDWQSPTAYRRLSEFRRFCQNIGLAASCKIE